MKSILSWFIAQEKETEHPMIVNELPIVLINGQPIGTEWERITEDMTEEDAEQLRAEILFADRDGRFYPGWQSPTPEWETYGGAGYDPSID